MTKRLSICVALILAGFFTPASATTLTVKQNDSSAFNSIQSAIDVAEEGDEIIVHPGRYVENIEFNGKNIILRSTDPLDWSVVEQTIIDGDRQTYAVRFAGNETSSCVLSGFTIRGGHADENSSPTQFTGAGGIYGGEADCYATIEHNLITSNTSSGYWYRPNPYYEEWIGGVSGGISGCHGLIQYNRITDNYGRRWGGGLSNCNGTIQHNEITSNSAE